MTITPALQKRIYIGIGVIVALCAFFILMLWLNTRQPQAPAPAQPQAQEPVTRVSRRIDGVSLADASLANPYPVAVMIENSSDAWPLSGLDQAQLVYETLAEGWIPRFLAVFASDAAADRIGPVRSARPYFIDLIEPYRVAYMHVGGSPESLRILRTTDRVVNIDQFFKDQYFWRSQKRWAPHNVYTSTLLMKKALVDLNLTEGIEYPMWKYTTAEPSIDTRPRDVKDIVVNFTTKTYQARWKYDRDFNAYTRYQQNTLFTMEDGAVVRAKNVIIQVTDMEILDSVGRRDVETVGEGRAVVFRDGAAIEGTWKRLSTRELTRYFDANGNEIELNPGTTWVEIVPSMSIVEY